MGEEKKDWQISFAPSVLRGARACGLRQAIEAIRAGHWLGQVEKCRAAGSAEERRRAKLALPAFYFSGTFAEGTPPRNDTLLRHSGLLALDFDAHDDDGPEAEKLASPGTRAAIAADPHVVAVFASAGGKGLKAVVAVTATDKETHRRCFAAAAAWFREKHGLVADAQCKDARRACFVSYDPGAVLKEGAEAFQPQAEETAGRLTADHQEQGGDIETQGVEGRARAYLAKMPPAVAGRHGHDALFQAALAMAVGFDLPPLVAGRLLLESYNPRCQPPWEEKDVARKVAQANASELAQTRRGWLRDAPGRGAGASAPACPYILKGEKKKEPSAREAMAPFMNPGGALQAIMGFIDAGAHVMQPEFSLLAALTLCGAALGRKVEDADGTRTNLYCLAIGPSGCGKNRALEAVRELCADPSVKEAKLIAGKYRSGSAIIRDLETTPRRLALIDEVGQFLTGIAVGSRNNQHALDLSGALLELFNAAASPAFVYDNSVAHGDHAIVWPHLCLYGTGTPETVFEGLTTRQLSDGLLGRAFIVPGREGIEHGPGGRPTPPREAVEWLAHWLGDGGLLANTVTAPAILTVPTDAEAKAALDAFRALKEERQREGKLGAVWVRAHEKAKKLALIHACSRDALTPQIDAESAAWATGLAEALTRATAATVRRWCADNEQERLARKVLQLVRDAGEQGITRNALVRKCQSIAPRMRDEIVRSLEEGELIAATEEETATKSRVVYRALEVEDE